MSEADFYSGHPDGPTWLEMARENCFHLVPPPPPTDDPCAKYYRGIKSTKGPRAEFSQAGANPKSNPNSLPHVYGRGQMAHRVPLVHLRANTDNINPILPLGNILPQMNANQRKRLNLL